ncbi:MAG: 3-phosphoserine/phosphohydroxythreonine transaminase [Acidimicrobiales bacterium]
MTRVHNFCAGPCTLPVTVLEELQDGMVEFGDSGMSLIEMSHRSDAYDAVHQETLSLLRELCSVPDDVEVMLLQGGASLQFAMLAMNLLIDDRPGGYIRSGSWGNKAHSDAQKVIGSQGPVSTYVAWDGADSKYMTMPTAADLTVDPASRFVHVTTNETIGGVRLNEVPDLSVPVVADMSSDYLSRPIDWDRVDVVYGGAQKNLGPAGLAVVFARRSLIDEAPALPSYLSYKTHADNDSLANTPPMFPIWAMGGVLRWMRDLGGLTELEARAAKRSGQIYDAIDSSGGYFRSPVDRNSRSHMNIVFRVGADDAASAELEPVFLSEAAAADMVNLAGHRSVGGMRASTYNALPDESVTALTDFMSDFMARNG